MNKLELLKKKIKYRCSYRGTKEMDILLTSFVNSIINDLKFSDLLKLEEFLNLGDEEIYNFYLNDKLINSFNNKKILNLFKSFEI